MTNVTECTACHNDSQVIDSREWNGFIRRNRRCLVCERTWRTVEVPASYVDEREAARDRIPKVQHQIEALAKELAALGV